MASRLPVAHGARVRVPVPRRPAGHPPARTRPAPRHPRVMVALRTFELVYDGQAETVTRGQSYIAPGHEIVERFPDRFRAVSVRSSRDAISRLLGPED